MCIDIEHTQIAWFCSLFLTWSRITFTLTPYLLSHDAWIGVIDKNSSRFWSFCDSNFSAAMTIVGSEKHRPTSKSSKFLTVVANTWEWHRNKWMETNEQKGNLWWLCLEIVENYRGFSIYRTKSKSFTWISQPYLCKNTPKSAHTRCACTLFSRFDGITLWYGHSKIKLMKTDWTSVARKESIKKVTEIGCNDRLSGGRTA